MSAKPFAGLAFCCTAIPLHQREVIAGQIKTLGGTHFSDLMSDVNYLIVGDRNTEKYKYCVRNRSDITFIQSTAIEKVYNYWINGEDSNLNINDYKLGIFQNMLVCLSRISIHNENDEIDFKKLTHRKNESYFNDIYNMNKLSSMIIKNGGKVSESLTSSCDLVITTQMSGKRYDKAIEWKIPVVHPVYVFDSLIRLTSLDPQDYLLKHVFINSDKKYLNGCLVWDDIIRQNQKSLKPHNTHVNNPIHDNNNKNDKSIENSKNGNAKKNEHVDEDMKNGLKKDSTIWNSVMNHAGKPRSKFIKNNAWSDDNEQDQDDDEDDDDDEQSPLKKRKLSSTTNIKNQLFLGLKFLIIGFTNQQLALLNKVITSHGGEVEESDQSEDYETITHIILPFKIGSQSSTILRMLDSKLKSLINKRSILVVTEWFLERSIYYNKITIDNWCKPLKGLIKSNKPFKICITGFTGIELLHLTKLIEILNFEFCDSLTSQKDLLILNINLFKSTLLKSSPLLYKYKYLDILNCPTTSTSNLNGVSLISLKNKINAAKKWNIPIVSISYIWEMVDKSVGKDNLVIPDIMNLQWCLFAPMNYAKPKTLLDYVRNLSGNNFETQVSTTEDEKDDKEQQVKLPSPRKVREKQKYGRLMGNSSESLTSKLLNVKDHEEDGQHQDIPSQQYPNDNDDDDNNADDNDITNIEDEELTQVGYQNDNLLKSNQELLKKLGVDDEVSNTDKTKSGEIILNDSKTGKRKRATRRK